jgi:hypothetical protein
MPDWLVSAKRLISIPMALWPQFSITIASPHSSQGPPLTQMVVDGRRGVAARKNDEQDCHASVDRPECGKPGGVWADKMWDWDHAQKKRRYSRGRRCRREIAERGGGEEDGI